MNGAGILSQTVNCRVVVMRHNSFDMLKVSLKFPRCIDSDKASMESRLNLLPGMRCRYLCFFTLILLLSTPVGVHAVDESNDADDKCSPGAWLKLDAEYMEALRASDMGRLRGLKSKKEALQQECNRSGFPGHGSTGSGGTSGGQGGPGSVPPAATGTGGPPGSGPGSPETEPPVVTSPGTPPATQKGGDSKDSGGAAPEDKDSGDTLTAEERKRKDEWDKRQDLTEGFVRDQAMFEEANVGAVTTLWNDFLGSVGESFGVTDPPEPIKPPSFDELLANGDPLAIRLQQIRDQVGDGVPTQQQLDEIRKLSKEAQRRQNAAGVALVNTNTTAADLATAGEVISKIGVEGGKAAAVYIMVTTYGMDPHTAEAAASAVYDGLQHYDKGVTSVIGHGVVSAGSSYLGNVAGGKLGERLGDAAQTTGGLIKQGAVSGGSSAAVSSIGNTVVEGKDLNAGDVIIDTVIGTVVGGGLEGGDIGIVTSEPIKHAAGELGTSIKDGIKADPESPAVKLTPVKLPDTLTETIAK